MSIFNFRKEETGFMFGAVIGDIVGSTFEFDNYRAKDFKLFAPGSRATDDSIMTIAIADALLASKDDGYASLGENAVKSMQTIGRPYTDCGYGGRFYHWMYSDTPAPYNSFGNGSAMRVSAVAYAATSLEECKELSRKVTEVTHNHPEGIKGAEATAVCCYLALHGASKAEISEYVRENYYTIDFTIDEIRPTYLFNETCQETVPQALEAFFEAEDFEDALRTAISVGGDSDTLAAITCAIAGAYYGVPEDLAAKARKYLDKNLRAVIDRFAEEFDLK